MKNLKIITSLISLIMILTLTACQNKLPVDSIKPLEKTTLDTVTPSEDKSPDPIETLEKSTGQIYLYGERHGIETILDKELELWGEYYTNDNMRHLFIEFPYYTAEFLNIWMKSDNDDILEEIYDNWKGTLSYSTYVKEFYKKIKSQYPETIFYGTDVGHQHDTIGQRFLKYLKDNNLENTEQYLLTQEIIEQGIHYYKYSDDVYRENKMVENLIREFDKLKDKNVMGIYGTAHTKFGEKVYKADSVLNMASQLKEKYGDNIYSEDLSSIPIRVDIITINQKDYEASYFGVEDLTGFKNFRSREFWRLENAYEDFKDNKKSGDWLPYSNYPVLLEKGQVFAIKYKMIDGSVYTAYYRSDGNVIEGYITTEEFLIE